MRLRSSFVVLLFCAWPLFATTVTVDCTGAPATFTSINVAVGTLDFIGPHTVNIIGVCNENVSLFGRDRITFDGSPTIPSGIHAPAGTVVNVQHAHTILFRRLTISGGGRGIWAHAASDIALLGVTIENTGSGLTVWDKSFCTVGGNQPSQFVTVHNCSYGILLDDASLTSNGFLTVENNTVQGLDVETARVVFIGEQNLPQPGGQNIVRNNGAHGIFAKGSTNIDIIGRNLFSGNALNAILLFQNATADIAASAGGYTTTMENNGRGGAAAIFNSTLRLTGVIIQNNGDGSSLASGVTSAQNSSALVSATQITGTNGAGVIVEAGGMIRLAGTTVTGSTAAPFLLRTGGIAELQAGNTLDPGTGKYAIQCDATTVLFGDGADVPTDCKKK